MDGVRNGFYLVNEQGYEAVEQDNYKSALTNASIVEKEIKNEIEEGRYVVVQEKPLIVSAMGSILKDNGSARLIHDGSKPNGLSLNSFATIDEKKKFETIKHAEALIENGYYMAKIDLKKAYRSVLIHPSQYKLTGLEVCWGTGSYVHGGYKTAIWSTACSRYLS